MNKFLSTFKYFLLVVLMLSSVPVWAGQRGQLVPLAQTPSLNLGDMVGQQPSTQPAINPLAQEDGEDYRLTPAEWIIQSGIHRIMGYVAMGTTLAAATTAILAPEIHPPFGWAAVGTTLGATVLGAIGYWDLRAQIWPHFLFMGLAEIGLAMNAFGVFEPGSLAHRITGISSVVSMAAGYLAIRLIF